MSRNPTGLGPKSMVLSVIAAALVAACGGGSGSADDGAEAAVSERRATAVSAGGADAGTGTATWTPLASEWGSFTVTGTQTVRYGAGTSWVTTSVTGTGSCTNAFFGRDPAVGMSKSCQLQSAAVAAAAPTWVKVAVEWGSFTTTGTQSVRYGAGSSWATKSVTGGANCTNAFFGGDPAVGQSKWCEALQAPAGATTPPTTAVATLQGPRIDNSKMPTGWAGVPYDIVRPTTEIAQPSDSGDFRTSCEYSHMAYDDPIVYPGQPGKSHLHAFFGNTGANASSTAASLSATGNSTCRGGTVNRSAYWVPALIDTRDGTPVKPMISNFYYKTGYNNIPKASFRALPQGLRMIAGDAMNATATGSFGFKCIDGGGNETMSGKSVQNCGVGQTLIAEVWFPQCWDGVNLDSPDHKSHMAYLTGDAVCPSTHPVALPQITFNVQYAVTEKDSARRWRLASDTYDAAQPAGYSMHGDWFNGWKKDIMDAWVKGCNQASRDCHAHLLGDGRMIDF
jgi:hypothetical protein